MTLEELQAMSDRELDKLAAIKFLWGGFVNEPTDDWNPATDMNDAMLLFVKMVEETNYIDATITYPWYVVAGWNPMSDEGGWEIQVEDEKLPRAVTIAAILAKENI